MTLFIGVAIGMALSAGIAGLVWIHLTKGDDHPLTREEVKQRVGEAWG